MNIETPGSGDLTSWAQNGVLLLNSILTVEADNAASHQKKGWETFTDAALSALSSGRKDLVFLLWGSYAASKAKLLDEDRHDILVAPHPSPLSAHKGFFGCGHFFKANERLVKSGIAPVKWDLCK